MSTIQLVDHRIWRDLLPRVRESWFKSKSFIFIALFYVSLFRLPRRYLFNYLFGQGQQQELSTEKLILANPEVYRLALEQIELYQGKKIHVSRIPIPQILLTAANYRYAIGSFTLCYTLEGEKLNLYIQSKYQFTRNIDRLTKHLHNHMVQLEEKGKATPFPIRGKNWLLSLSEFRNLNPGKNRSAHFGFDRLYL